MDTPAARPPRRPPWGWGVALLLAGAALVVTNPDEQDFESFAGATLARYASKELCGSGGLPLIARLVLQNCADLVQAQQQALGRLALAETRRYNAGLFSLYRTELGGQTLMPGLRIPRYRSLTLAGAGQLVVLHVSRDGR